MKRLPVLTVGLIAVCVAVAAMTAFGSRDKVLHLLSMQSPGGFGLEDVAAGEVWRLLTPVFIHFGPVHLLVNMIWLWDLGRMIEARRGARFLAGFVVVIAVASNAVQFLAEDASFGGMSGVVYGMLAYVWMQSRAGANSGYALRRFDVLTSVGWFVLCWSGAFGAIANWAHTAGLAAGLAWGFVDTSAARRADRPPPAMRARLARLSNIAARAGMAVGAVALAVALGSVIVGSQDRVRGRACAGAIDLLDPDQRIALCSAIVGSTRSGADARASALVERGDAYRAKAQYDLATRDYAAAIALDPGSARAYAGRGLARLNSGQAADGDADVARARQIDPAVGRRYPELRYRQMADQSLAGLDTHDAVAVDAAMRGLVRRILTTIPPATPTDRSADELLISFRTDADGVSLSPRLRATYPATTMTIRLQYQYRDLVVTPRSMVVNLSFGGVAETVEIPFRAMTYFEDRTANYRLPLADIAAAAETVRAQK